MKRITAFAIALMLAGCATRQIDPQSQREMQTPLVCKNAVQCDTWWKLAQVWVTQNSGYRIQTVTDSIIVTFGPIHSEMELAFTVTKSPRSDGSSEIVVRASCGNIFGCRPDAVDAVVAFNRYLRNTP